MYHLPVPSVEYGLKKIKEMFIFEEQAKEKYAFKSSALLYSLSWYFTKPVLSGTVIYALISRKLDV